MDIKEIPIEELYVSNVNVRKTLHGEEDETNIQDLANDIKINGLINPITVRYNTTTKKYEIIAGQRRFNAALKLNMKKITCNVLDINEQKAEEISLVENVQRNQMTTTDKIRAYKRLYDYYDQDINKVISAIHVSKQTLQKYLKLASLSDEIIYYLDSKNDDKISIDVAVELTRLPDDINKDDVLKCLNNMTNVQKIEAIKDFNKRDSYDLTELEGIKEKLILKATNIEIKSIPSYVYDISTNKGIIIPVHLYEEVIELIKNKTQEVTYLD
jgi:ParB/RepB/Spo0J family partition protein